MAARYSALDSKVNRPAPPASLSCPSKLIVPASRTIRKLAGASAEEVGRLSPWKSPTVKSSDEVQWSDPEVERRLRVSSIEPSGRKSTSQRPWIDSVLFGTARAMRGARGARTRMAAQSPKRTAAETRVMETPPLLGRCRGRKVSGETGQAAGTLWRGGNCQELGQSLIPQLCALKAPRSRRIASRQSGQTA